MTSATMKSSYTYERFSSNTIIYYIQNESQEGDKEKSLRKKQEFLSFRRLPGEKKPRDGF
jgi:hypothetical protein